MDHTHFVAKGWFKHIQSPQPNSCCLKIEPTGTLTISWGVHMRAVGWDLGSVNM